MNYFFTKGKILSVCLGICVVAIYMLFAVYPSKKVSTKVEEREGLLYLIGDDEVFTGNVVDTIAGKIIQYEVVRGKKNGEFRLKHVNGNLIMKGTIKENLNEGTWNYYYPNGKLESSGNFVNNLAEGKWIWYYESGDVKEIGFFKAGKKEGSWTIFDENGNLKRKLYFKEDRVVFDQEFDKELIS